MKFNVGDIVALSPDKNPYKYPGISQAYHWLGIVTEVDGRRFTAKTVQHVYEWCMDDIIKNLDERDFDFVRSSLVKPQVVSTMPKDNPFSHPSHYTDGKIEVIDFIEDKGLNFNRGNAVKYICRAGKKDPTKEIEDLEKAMWYINHEIERLKGAKK